MPNNHLESYFPPFSPDHHFATGSKEQDDPHAFNYQRVYYLESGYPSFSELLKNFNRDIEETGETIPHLLILEAPPGTGKTHYVIKTLHPMFERLSNKLQNRTGQPLKYALFHWDDQENALKFILNEAYQAQKTQTPYSPAFSNLVRSLSLSSLYAGQPRETIIADLLSHIPYSGQPYDPEFLSLTSTTLKHDIVQFSSQKIPYSLAIIDKPGGLGFQHDDPNIWTNTREYANSIMHDITHRQPPFNELSPQITTAYLGMVAGPTMELGREYRNLRNRLTGLDEAREMARIFHKKPASSYEELRASQEGGSVDQYNYTRQLLREFIFHFQDKLQLPDEIQTIIKLPYTPTLLENTTIPIPQLSDPYLIHLAHQAEAIAPLIDKPPLYILWETCWSLAEARVLERVALKAQPNYFCIGYNNPTDIF